MFNPVEFVPLYYLRPYAQSRLVSGPPIKRMGLFLKEHTPASTSNTYIRSPLRPTGLSIRPFRIQPHLPSGISFKLLPLVLC